MNSLTILVPILDPDIELLDETISSILQSVMSIPHVEVMIVDNGSCERVDKKLSKLGLLEDIKYKRFETNLGYDYNLRRSVELTDSDYVWFIGDDDLIDPRAVESLVDQLQLSDHEIYQFYPVFFTEEPDWVAPRFSASKEDHFPGAALSSLVFKRQALLKAFLKLEDGEMGSNWSHFLSAHVIERMLGVSRCILQDPLVAVRLGRTQSWESHFGNQFLSFVSLVEALGALSTRKLISPVIFEEALSVRLKSNVTQVLTLTSRVEAKELTESWGVLDRLAKENGMSFPIYNRLLMGTPKIIRSNTRFLMCLVGLLVKVKNLVVREK